MRNPLPNIFTGWPFLLSLGLLIANDTCLKSAWPGWVTGKLSDFAGMALLGLLLYTMFPRRTWSISLGLAAGFLYWKSEASDALIAAFNTLGWWNAGRTVDYSDMIALTVLPFCWAWARRPGRDVAPVPLRRLFAWPVATLTLAAMMGTSAVTLQRHDSIRAGQNASGWDRARVADVIKSVAEQQGLKCGDCSRLPGAATYWGSGGLTYRFVADGEVAFELTAPTPSILPLPSFSRTGMEWIEETRRLLKKAFANNFPGLEYVESLSPPSGTGRP
jgi:hypothetical protein